MKRIRPPAAPEAIEWADVLRNVVHLVHEVVLADLEQLEQVREELIRRGLDVPALPERTLSEDPEE